MSGPHLMACNFSSAVGSKQSHKTRFCKSLEISPTKVLPSQYISCKSPGLSVDIAEACPSFTLLNFRGGIMSA